MTKLQNFAYKATTPARPTSTDVVDTRPGENIATPVPQRIPLSDLMSNTPRTVESVDVSPGEDKIVWKMSPKNTVGQASQESPNGKITTFLSILAEEIGRASCRERG